jgi:hypothetical protein
METVPLMLVADKFPGSFSYMLSSNTGMFFLLQMGVISSTVSTHSDEWSVTAYKIINTVLKTRLTYIIN